MLLIVLLLQRLTENEKFEEKTNLERKELTKRVIRQRSKNNIHSRTIIPFYPHPFTHLVERKRKERKERVISSSYTGNDSLSTGQHSRERKARNPRCLSRSTTLFSFHNSARFRTSRVFQRFLLHSLVRLSARISHSFESLINSKYLLEFFHSSSFLVSIESFHRIISK